MKKLCCVLTAMFALLLCTSAYATANVGDGAKLFYIETVSEEDIFIDNGGTIEVKRYIEYDGSRNEEVCAGAYVYNDSLTNGDCVEMMIILVEYSGEGAKKIEKLNLKSVHACPGDNGKFVYTDPVEVDFSHTLKAFIWGKENIIPYVSSTGQEH